MPKRLLPQSNNKALLAWFVITLAIAFYSLYKYETLSRQNSQRITEISQLRNKQILLAKRTDFILCTKFMLPIRQTLMESRKSLDVVSYYKTHPDEKAKAEAQIDHELSLFKLSFCNHLPSSKIHSLGG